MTIHDHLSGPWQAVISNHGDAYDSVRTALIELGQDGEVDISVRRGTAAPDDGYLPGSYQTGDVAYELEDVYLVDPDDPSVGAEARFAQAQSMAAGLNAAIETARLREALAGIADYAQEHATAQRAIGSPVAHVLESIANSATRKRLGGEGGNR